MQEGGGGACRGLLLQSKDAMHTTACVPIGEPLTCKSTHIFWSSDLDSHVFAQMTVALHHDRSYVCSERQGGPLLEREREIYFQVPHFLVGTLQPL